jgi:myo-inositol 2-dehydrogenase / D-chiro-inositol 1-dehydrogenase
MTQQDPAAPVGVALVGCGRIARMFHLPVLRDDPAARLIAVVDPDPQARQESVRIAPGTVATDDLARVVDDPAVEAVVIATPTHHHLGPAVQALEAGRRVYVEKPLAANADDAHRLADTVRAVARAPQHGPIDTARTHLGVVGFNFRLHPQVAAARASLAVGELGRLVAIRGLFASAPRELPAWKQDPATGGGALRDLATHHLDLVTHLTGADIVSVDCRIRSVTARDDTATLRLELDSGLDVQLIATACAAPADRIELIGTRRTLLIDRMGRRSAQVTDVDGPVGPVARLDAARNALRRGFDVARDGVRPPAEPSFAAALHAFVIADGSAPLATFGDGLAVAAVVDAAERSAELGAAQQPRTP